MAIHLTLTDVERVVECVGPPDPEFPVVRYSGHGEEGLSECSSLQEVVMCRSVRTRTAFVSLVILLGTSGHGHAQIHAQHHTDLVLLEYKEIARTTMKGELLAGFNKALSLSPSAVLDQARRIRGDANTVAQSNAVLQKALPLYQKLSFELRQEYGRLARENQELRAEHARLRTVPKWSQRSQLDAAYRARLGHYQRDYQVYLAKSEARRAVVNGMHFCAYIIKQRDSCRRPVGW